MWERLRRRLLGPSMTDTAECAECRMPVAAGMGVRAMGHAFCSDEHAGRFQEAEMAP